VTLDVDVQYAVEIAELPSKSDIEHWVESAVGDRREAVSMSLRIVNEAEAKQLNMRWRGIESPTNVLAFPCDPPEHMPELLGDVVICAPIVLREAEVQAKPAGAHWAHLVVHGTLHLLGFDHETPQDALRMESLETAVLQSIGFADPYQAA
jgi:probable rRNA maturation factor